MDLLRQELTSTAFGNPTAILTAIIRLPVLRYSCGVWRFPLFKAVPHFLSKQLLQAHHVLQMSGCEITPPVKAREEQGTPS